MTADLHFPCTLFFCKFTCATNKLSGLLVSERGGLNITGTPPTFTTPFSTTVGESHLHYMSGFFFLWYGKFTVVKYRVTRKVESSFHFDFLFIVIISNSQGCLFGHLKKISLVVQLKKNLQLTFCKNIHVPCNSKVILYFFVKCCQIM